MLLTLEEAKLSLRIDDDYEDAYISELIQVSEDYLRDGITGYDLKVNNGRFKNKAKLCCRVLVAEMYNKRALTTEKTEKYSYCIRSIMTQMEYCNYEVSI